MLITPVVCATDRSKAGVRLKFLFCMALCFCFYYDTFHVESYLVICSHDFSVLFSIVIRKSWSGYKYVSPTFVLFILHAFLFVFFSSSWGRGWLRIVIVALPGFFSYFFL